MSLFRQQYLRFFYSVTAIVVSISVALGLILLNYSSQLRNLCDCTNPIGLSLGFIGLPLLGAVSVLALGKAGLMVLSTQRFRRRLSANIIRTTVCAGIRIHQVSWTNSLATCVGWFRPEIYISTSLIHMLQPWELWAVLRHELSHAIHHDPLYRCVLQIMQTFFPFNRSVFAHHHALQELVADELVADNKNLRAALLKLIQLQQHRPFVVATFFSAINLRIDRLLGKQISVPRYRNLGIALLVLLTLVISAYRSVATNAASLTPQACVQQQFMCQYD